MSASPFRRSTIGSFARSSVFSRMSKRKRFTVVCEGANCSDGRSKAICAAASSGKDFPSSASSSIACNVSLKSRIIFCPRRSTRKYVAARRASRRLRGGGVRRPVGVAQLAPEFLVLAPRGAHEVRRMYDATVRGGVEGGGERDVFDVAAGEPYGARQRAELHVVAERGFGGEDRAPDAPPVLLVGERELDDDAHAAHESLVHVLPEVRGEDGDAVELFDLLKEVSDFDVGEAVVRVLNLRALAEERVGLVEEEDGVAALRLAEDAVEVLLRLADVLADDLREVDLEEVEPEFVRDDFRRHRLPRSGRPREQRDYPAPRAHLPPEAPLAVDDVAALGLRADFPQLLQLIFGQLDVVPRVLRLDLRGERREVVARLRARRREQLLRRRLRLRTPDRRRQGCD